MQYLPGRLTEIVEDFEDRRDCHLGRIKTAKHQIKSDDGVEQRFYSAPYRSEPMAMYFERGDTEKMVRVNFIDPAQTEKPSSILFTTKYAVLRIRVDYRTLNVVTIRIPF